MPTEPRQAWTRPQRRLHWWTAGLVMAGFALAWLMVALPLTTLLLKFVLYQLHKTIGLTVFGLTSIRLAVLRRRGRPPMDDPIPEWQRRFARLVHRMLYGLLLVVPLLGYLTAATSVTEVPTLFLGLIPIPHIVGPDAAWSAVLTPMHRALAISLVLLAGGHAMAALRHHQRGSAVMRRMWRG